jgi:hypothetical protein
MCHAPSEADLWKRVKERFTHDPTTAGRAIRASS